MGKVLVVSLCFWSVFVGGCATIICGTSEDVTFSTEPSGANIIVAGVPRGQTPATLSLDTDENHVVILKKDGYKDSTLTVGRDFNAWTLGNVVIFWIVGFIVDFADGAAWDFDQNLYHVTLEPEKK